MIKFVEKKSKTNESISAPVPLPEEDETDKEKQENEEEASLKKYNVLAAKDKAGTLDYNENALLALLKKKNK